MGVAGIGTPYWYEWEIGLIECLKMLLDSSVDTVTLQSFDFVSLDDVVIKYKDESITNIQVKYTDVENNFTYSFLTSGEKPLLKTWGKEWLTKKEAYIIREIRIVTNKAWGTNKSNGRCSFESFVTKIFPKLKNDYSYRSEEADTSICNDAGVKRLTS